MRSYEKDLRTRIMYTPRPEKPPSHSAMTAPTIAYVALMRNPEKNCPAAAGSLAYQKTCQRLARIVRIRSTTSGSTLRKPRASPTVTGKNVVSTTSTTLGTMPKPNHSTSRGARAMVGIVCDTVTMGSRARPSHPKRSISTATTKPNATPMPRPSAASYRVVMQWPPRSAASSANDITTCAGDGRR